MAYVLQAVIASPTIFGQQQFPESRLVNLSQGMCLLPLTTGLRKHLNIPDLSLTDTDDGMVPATNKLPQEIAKFCLSLSQNGRVAYLEAEFFGSGVQASAVFEEGRHIQTLISTGQERVGAINSALQLLGVTTGDYRDEFDALKLGQYRDTDKWVQGSIPTA